MAATDQETYKQRLLSLYDDIVMDVVRVYFELKILGFYMGSLIIFLNSHIHELFHAYKANVLCCRCQGAPPAQNRPLNINMVQFNTLFEETSQAREDHENKIDGTIIQYCLCTMSPKTTIQIKHIDISLLFVMINTCISNPAGNPSWIQNIKCVRNYLSHLGHASNISEEDFEENWNLLETSTLELANVVAQTYQDSVRRQIAKLKAQNTEVDNLTKALTMRNATLENKILEELRGHGVRIDNLCFRVQQAEFNREDLIVEKSSTSNPETTNDQLNLNLDNTKCIVSWKFAMPGNWNVQQMVEKLRHLSNILDFKVEFVHEGSLIIETSASFSLLTDEDKFVEAIRGFLEQLVQECEIDSTIKADVDIDLIIIYVPTKERGDFTKLCLDCKDKEKQLNSKDAEITRLKEDLEYQLERMYSSVKLDMSQISALSLRKDAYIEKPLDDLLARWEEGEDNISESLESAYSSTTSSTADKSPDATVAKSDPTLADAVTKSDKTPDAALAKPETSDAAVTMPDEISDEEVTKPDGNINKKSGTDVTSKFSHRNKLKSELKRDHPPLFSKKGQFDLQMEGHIAVNGIAVTSDNQIIICNVCSKRLLMFSETGDLLDDCELQDNPWTLSLCPDSVNYMRPDLKTHIGIVTIPHKHSYQYFEVRENNLRHGKDIYVGTQCLAVKVTDKHILVGGDRMISVFNRNDEYQTLIQTQCGVAFIDLCPYRKGEFAQMFDYRIVILDDQNEIYCIEPEDEIGQIENEESKSSLYRQVVERFSVKKCEEYGVRESISSVAVGRHNQIYIVSNYSDCIYCLGSWMMREKTKSPTKAIFSTVLDDPNEITQPTVLCFCENYEKLYVATMNGRRIVIWNNNEYNPADSQEKLSLET